MTFMASPPSIHRSGKKGAEKGVGNRKTTFLHQCTRNRFLTPYLPRGRNRATERSKSYLCPLDTPAAMELDTPRASGAVLIRDRLRPSQGERREGGGIVAPWLYLSASARGRIRVRRVPPLGWRGATDTPDLAHPER